MSERPSPSTTGSITEARTVSADVLADLRGGSLLDPSFERRAAPLDARDRRWAQELLYGMLRRRAWLDALLSERVRGGLARLDPDLTDLLRLGVYQLLYMRSVPAYAAIAQTVELAKRRHGIGASKLANAVLRRVDRERQERGDEALALPPDPFSPSAARVLGAASSGGPSGQRQADPIDTLSLTHSHPRWLVARWVARWGADETARLLEAN